MTLGDALRRRAAEVAAQRGPAQGVRGGNRIIAARKLSGYAPLALDQLIDDVHARGARSARPDSGTLFPDFGDERASGLRGEALDPNHPDAAPGDTYGTGPGGTHRGGIPAGGTPGDNTEGRDRDAGYHAGYESGRIDGFKAGYEASLAHAERERRAAEAQAGADLAGRIATLSGALSARFEQIESGAADEIVELAIELARQALRSTIALRPEAIVDVVREALASLLDERSRIRLQLNPDDVELVLAALAGQAEMPGCEIVADAAIERGGCRIETPRAEIDARLQTRWRRTLAAIGRAEDGSLAGPHKDAI